MFKNIFIKTAISAGAGGIIYGIVAVFLNYFAPIVGVVAGFVSGMGLVLLGAHCDGNKKDSAANMFYFGVIAVLSLLIGYVLIYYFKTEVIHGMTFHPNDFTALPDFIADTLGIPDILSAVIGGLCSFALSNNKYVAQVK